MARLPQPGQDDGVWGDILNNFLGVAHSADGSIKLNSINEAHLSQAVRTKLNATGTEGPEGPQGPAGADGADGVDGVNGTDGAPGEKGDDGRSAYEVATANGFVGTEQQWLASLKGEKGDPGDGGSTPASVTWADVQNKPATFAPSAHQHSIADVTNLQTSLSSKVSHTTESYRVYATNGDSELAPLVWSSTQTSAYTVPVRDDQGRITAADPATSTQVATKGYVDAALPGTIMAAANTDGTQARPTSNPAVFVFWIGGTVAPQNALAHDVWLEETP